MSVTILNVADLGGRLLTVSCAFGAAPDGDPALWTWTDITADVLVTSGIQITRGRSDEAAAVEPSQLAFQVNNSDGRYTPMNPAGLYYPNVKLRVPVRVVLGGSTRFSGFVDEWPTAWPGKVSTWATSQVKASGKWRRLAQSPPFKSMAEEVLTYLKPSSYYPMTDGPAALAFADRSGNNRPDQPVTNWTPGGADYTSLNTDQSNGGVDRRSAAFYPSTLPWPVNGPQTIAFTGHTPGTSASFFYYALTFATNQQIVDLLDSAGVIWRIADVAGSLSLQRIVGTTTTTVAALGALVANPVLVNWTQSGSNVSVTFWSPVGSASGTVNNITVPTIVSAVLYPVVYSSGSEPDQVAFAGHVGLYDDAMTATELTFISNAFLWGQASDPTEANPLYNPEAWIRSRARMAGYRDAQIVLDSTDALLDYAASDAALGGKGRVEAMRVAAEGELGLLYETLDGGVGFRSRDSRYTTSVWLTVDRALNDIADPPEPTFDDQRVINDVTVTRRQGQGRYADQASIDSIGLFQKSVSSIGFQQSNYGLDFSASQQAAWIVNTSSQPKMRVPKLKLRLSNRAALADGWVVSEPVGSRLQVLNMPSQVGSSTLDLFVEGYTETIMPFEWTVEANLSPADPYNRLWKIEAGANAGRLELDGQTLGAGYSSSATSFSVATSAGKPLLVTTAAIPSSFPFDVEVAGERVTVTAITGASSPQTVTVTRSVNGVVKAQSSGAVLKLWRPGVLKI